MPVKNFLNRSIIGEDMDKSEVPRFLWPTVYCTWRFIDAAIVTVMEFTFSQRRSTAAIETRQ